MEVLGFEKEVDWLQIRIDIPEEVPAKYARVAQYARETIGLRVVKRSKEEIRGEYGQRAFRLFNQAPHDIYALLVQQVGGDIGLIEQQILCRIVQNRRVIKGKVVKYRFGGEIILGSDERNRYIKRKPIDHMGFLCLHTAGE